MGDRFLVTAGNTRERIDAVRDWGNIFTGNTGLAIARALAEVGPVELLTSNQEHLRELADGMAVGHGITAAGFTTHADLKAALAERMARGRYRGVFMTAAVSDYRPAGAFEVVSREAGGQPGEERWVVRDALAGKVSSRYDRVAFLGERTEKLVDLFRTAWGFEGLLVKFKLEVGVGVEKLLEIGRSSRLASGADYLVANTLEMVEGAGAGAWLIGADGETFVPRGQLPARMAGLAREGE